MLSLLPASGMSSPGGLARSHLYVAASYGGSGGIYRYPLSNGIPATTPDLFYPHMSSPMAIGPNGDLYSVVSLPDGIQNEVKVFAAGTTRLERHLILPAGAGYESEADIAVDRSGYLFVSHYDNGFGAVARKPDSANGFLLVYRPGARGNDSFSHYVPGFYGGFALDEHGVLYAARSRGFDGEIQVFTHPETSLKVARTFSSDAMVRPEGIALDESGVLHLFDGARTDYVSSYSDGSTGEVTPVGTFSLQVPDTDYTNITIGHRILYVPISHNNTVVGYPIVPSGGAVLFTLGVPYPPTDVELGP
jgi:hypothetical protein